MYKSYIHPRKTIFSQALRRGAKLLTKIVAPGIGRGTLPIYHTGLVHAPTVTNFDAAAEQVAVEFLLGTVSFREKN